MPHPCPHHCPGGSGSSGAAAAAVVAIAAVVAAVARPVIRAAEDVVTVALICAAVLGGLALCGTVAFLVLRAHRRAMPGYLAAAERSAAIVTRPSRAIEAGVYVVTTVSPDDVAEEVRPAAREARS